MFSWRALSYAERTRVGSTTAATTTEATSFLGATLMTLATFFFGADFFFLEALSLVVWGVEEDFAALSILRMAECTLFGVRMDSSVERKSAIIRCPHSFSRRKRLMSASSDVEKSAELMRGSTLFFQRSRENCNGQLLALSILANLIRPSLYWYFLSAAALAMFLIH